MKTLLFFLQHQHDDHLHHQELLRELHGTFRGHSWESFHRRIQIHDCRKQYDDNYDDREDYDDDRDDYDYDRDDYDDYDDDHDF